MPGHLADLRHEREPSRTALAFQLIPFVTDRARDAKHLVRRHVEVHQCLTGHLDGSFELRRRDFLNAESVKGTHRLDAIGARDDRKVRSYLPYRSDDVTNVGE